MTLLNELKRLRDECTPGKWERRVHGLYDFIRLGEDYFLTSETRFPLKPADAELIALQRNHLDDVIRLVEAAEYAEWYLRETMDCKTHCDASVGHHEPECCIQRDLAGALKPFVGEK